LALALDITDLNAQKVKPELMKIHRFAGGSIFDVSISLD
jgi:hypothetical protein